MPASEARIQANRMNAAKSTGPRTTDGKERSRANSLQHGMTGAGVVLPEGDAAEVDRRAEAFARELDAVGELEHALARRAALNSVRMERAADQQTQALSEHVRRVDADFVPPEGVDEAEADRLRSEAARRAMFDSSREATLARKYEAAAERGFYRAIKEIRQLQKQPKGLDPGIQAEAFRKELGSFLSDEAADAGFDAMLRAKKAEAPSPTLSTPKRGPSATPSAPFSASTSSFEVPFAIGRRR